MKTVLRPSPGLILAGWLACAGPGWVWSQSNPAATEPEVSVSLLLSAEGRVEIARAGTSVWLPAQTNRALHAGDRVRTGPRSRTTLRLFNLTVLRVKELSILEIQPPAGTAAPSSFDLQTGGIYLFNRDRPSKVPFRTPVASGAVRGTEFYLGVTENGRTELALLDGAVAMRNDAGEVVLASGEQAIVEPGQAPRKTALIEAINLIQWVLYYPGVLNVEELDLAAAERDALHASLEAYRAGDLPSALQLYPVHRQPVSEAEKVYHGAVLLAAGQVVEAAAVLSDVNRRRSDISNQKAEGGGAAVRDGNPQSAIHNPQSLAAALLRLVAVVKNQPFPSHAQPVSSTEWLVESYAQQARRDLPAALHAAQAAVSQSPQFGFGWVRVAELEFSFGRNDRAEDALARALRLAPRHAQATALSGFLLAARNRNAAARARFDQALAQDAALGQAWLGRGLMRLRQGDTQGGLSDLQVAATLEPNRAVLRSYLGKAFAQAGDARHAEKELALAQRLDPNDPTAWLYSALLRQQQNRINEGIADLERSRELNDNRSVFRSELLLDQDRAVRSANLAALYRDAGLTEIGTRAAARAVNDDYANYSAHQFLASSYAAQRDPKLINLRYETPFFSELLLANLLAPAGAGHLSQNVSQQEYSRLFDGNHVGVSSSTEYDSHGDWVQQGSHYGGFGNTSYAFDASYRSERGYRPNNDLEQTLFSLKAKQQLTPQDALLLHGTWFDMDSGDVAQYYNQDGRLLGAPTPSTTQRVKERQEPNVFLGYHHQWSPGSHLLFLGARLDDTLTLNDTAARIPFLTPSGNIRLETLAVDYRSVLAAYSAELQQIWQSPQHTTLIGGRCQYGWSDTATHVFDAVNPGLGRADTNQLVATDLGRLSGYAYHLAEVGPVQLTAGVSYDRLYYPRNIDTAPITSQQDTQDQLSPKAGLRWSPFNRTHLRAAYSRSLGGVFFDNSIRLEPTQLAGFTQAYRSLVPESIAGLVPATEFETWSGGLDQQFRGRLYVDVEAELLRSEAERTVGALESSFGFIPIPDTASSTRQTLAFEERTLRVTVNQLLGKEWSVGARYRLSDAELASRFPDIAPTVSGARNFNQDVAATLHQVQLFAQYYHRCGFFAQANGIWSRQENRGYATPLPGDDFWQANLHAGYRFLQRRGEASLGLLNVTDQDYRLNPLTLYRELPRERTLLATLKFYF